MATDLGTAQGQAAGHDRGNAQRDRGEEPDDRDTEHRTGDAECEREERAHGNERALLPGFEHHAIT